MVQRQFIACITFVLNYSSGSEHMANNGVRIIHNKSLLMKYSIVFLNRTLLNTCIYLSNWLWAWGYFAYISKLFDIQSTFINTYSHILSLSHSPMHTCWNIMNNSLVLSIIQWSQEYFSCLGTFGLRQFFVCVVTLVPIWGVEKGKGKHSTYLNMNQCPLFVDA